MLKPKNVMNGMSVQRSKTHPELLYPTKMGDSSQRSESHSFTE
jgi:hypothetical protein